MTSPRAVCFVLVLMAAASVAEAQIYTFRNADGTTVYSDKAPSDPVDEVRAYPVANAGSPVLADRPVSADYRADYDELIAHYAQSQGIRPDLVRAVVQVESGYNARAVSVKGALGLMQLMPGTATRMGVRRPFDPEENIRGGTTYLRRLLDRFGQNEELALAAYNAGPEAVDRYGNRIPPYRETRDYVRRIRTRTPAGKGAAPVRIYKTVEMIDGHPVVRYSDAKPAAGPYEVVSQGQ